MDFVRHVNGYLIDTSVFIAVERGQDLTSRPEGVARISVATLTELHIGLLRANDPRVREVRNATIDEAGRFLALPYDERVARQLAHLLFAAHRQQRRAATPDAIIAATALVHDLAVWTLDADFERLAHVAPELRVIRADTGASPP
ncbi:MAG TPA: PIN domain-containing protein [Dermatophilaceae bacterium]|nr:PIN domain-containing protein [Dermatophilaceae bacterium]